MADKKKVKDRIFKIILIIIIILLLIHNCVLIKKKGKGNIPSGNINIIEIICENNDKCDEKISDNGSNTNGSKKSDVGNSSNSSSKSDATTNNKSGSGTENKDDDTKPISSNGDEEEFDDDDSLSVLDSDIIWNDTTELKIFENSLYNFENIVAPESSNTYEFIVKNSTKYNLKYNISFYETNPYGINMRYKLKKNDTYLVDHYVSFNELNIDEQILNAKKNDTFYLEWKWVSSDNDNVAGENHANYHLRIDVKAESI